MRHQEWTAVDSHLPYSAPSTSEKQWHDTGHTYNLPNVRALGSTEVGKLSLIPNTCALNTSLTTELMPFLPRLVIPTLILWGEDAVFQPVRFGERLARDIPHARLVKIKDARHSVMID
jgi:pimeloyl-ACP methyl ester carboxylesterase